MCTTSMVAQNWIDRWPAIKTYYTDAVSREEFNALKQELEAVKKLLKAAKIYDEETGQPECEDAEKVAVFKRLAELVGVDLSEVFGR